MKLPLYQVDAFAEALFEGNPASVCPLERWLPDHLLQAIAAENNQSETAFFVPEGDAYHLRWFTPETEVELCGHATLAAARVLFDRMGAKGEHVTFRSASGPLHVTREGERLTLDFPAKVGIPCAAPKDLMEALGTTGSACYRAMDYLLVLENEAEVRSLRPDFRKLKGLDLRGVIVTAPGKNTDFVSRFFAPNCGIEEDPVTGSAHCTLAPYWAERLGKSTLTARQVSKRTGLLLCKVAGDRVFISGKAVLYMEGAIHLPA